MVPGIGHATAATPLLRVSKPVLRVLLCLLLSGSAGWAKESKPDDVPAPEFSLPGGVYTNDLKVAIKPAKGVVRFSLDGSEPGQESAAY